MIKKFSIFVNKRAFTLVEMLIAVSLFTVIVTISIGAILTVFDANRKAQASKTIVDNLNLSIENMARIVRFGSSYHCDGNINTTFSNPPTPANCANGGPLLAVNFKGNTIVYRLNGTTLERSDTGGSNGSYKPITSTDTVIQHLTFRVFGADEIPSFQQPYVVVVLRGYVGVKPSAQSNFTIETVMSQRALDL